MLLRKLHRGDITPPLVWFEVNYGLLLLFRKIVKVNVIRGLHSQIANKDTLTGLILILQSQITSQALKTLDLYPFKVEMFQITDLLVNITKHVLKPKHQVLTERAKQNLLRKYNIEEKQ
ncbi:DNA-directed RNA polymerase V subunit 5A-like [Rosa chinensis]|uniref:DNA-directed RNA polymerase V subunit 5A-like n=1 Tax=Rosa chinensis TaxID=74649 RepID=UPI001AD91687|nr:DNA-directed RNA polymerase V subunit 5A-like [Rosa chinensis]